MPAVADTQNTIVKRYENDPRVVTAIMSQQESAAVLDNYWRNIYLRTQMLFDPNGAVALFTYTQPPTGLPFSRAFIIGPDQTIVVPFFGHNTDLVYGIIDEMLEDMPIGDINVDGIVDGADVGLLLASWGEQPGNAADLNVDGVVDGLDLGLLLGSWTGN